MDNVINDLDGQEIIETFYEKKTTKKTNQQRFRIVKVIKKRKNTICRVERI